MSPPKPGHAPGFCILEAHMILKAIICALAIACVSGLTVIAAYKVEQAEKRKGANGG